ncbi:MAG TPA: AraC family transcriptional regulator [Jatrophihabitans sp.]|jgi:AraC-like DNA-binding protein|nr:AraC family transcriptional regulator [Jatrophihabitans sp.]
MAMDAVTAILDGHRARGAFLLRCVMAPPWSVRIDDRAEVAVLAQLRGSTTIVRGREVVRLEPGDVAIVRASDSYVIADEATTPPTAVVEPGQLCRALDPAAPPIDFGPGLRTWGNSTDGPDQLLFGVYELPNQVTGRLLDAVPDVVVVRADEWDVPLVALLGAEFERDAPGQDVVLDRYVDLVLISALRLWFAQHPDAAPQWWHASHDRIVGGALRLLHTRPDQPWTLAGLAEAVAVSRATLARRFQLLVGQPPMAYLTEWRLTMAADLLRDSRESIESIARRVGYGNAFAFSTAFKRAHGATPRDYRAAVGRAGRTAAR